MVDWREVLGHGQAAARRLPKLFWAAAGVVGVSLGAVLWLEVAGPPYAVLNEGLSPADGGKVIAQLQKLGIPYQLQAAGDVILVPAPELAQARLELGQAEVPGSDVSTAWDKLEEAPMTASDLAQSAMAVQALELSLQQSIQSMSGIQMAQVFLALPPETPFLADQPKPSAAVVIAADEAVAQTAGEAIANLIAGAVPGLSAAQVTVETTTGVTVYPASGMASGAQFSIVTEVENNTAARIAALLIPLVGAGNFQTAVSADLDFTQEHIHQVSYGPARLISHQASALSDQWGTGGAAIGIPGALSNEPPAATTATPASNATGTAASAQGQPQSTSSNLDQTFVTDQSDADITDPDWAVKSMSVSIVLNNAALGAVTAAQVKNAVTGALAYPAVTVSVLASAFQKPAPGFSAAPIAAAVPPLTHGLLEVMAAAALLFGLALPVGRRLATLNPQALLPPPRRPMPVVLPPRDFSELREQAGANIPGVARLLQSWAEDNE